MGSETNSELDQANLRIVVAAIAIVYISVLGFLPGQSLETYLPVIVYIVLFLIASIILRQVIARWPGHYPARRIFGMIHDYTGTSFGMVVGGEAALPLYAVMVWVNLGNGMRYGSRYLAIATALALLALLIVYQLTPVWQAQPFMVLLLPVIPVYIGFLLLAPLMGALASRLLALPAATARAVTFSASTRNSLVVLPLALALPEDVRGLAATAVILQTLVELVGELIYVRLIPRWVWPAGR